MKGKEKDEGKGEEKNEGTEKEKNGRVGESKICNDERQREARKEWTKRSGTTAYLAACTAPSCNAG